MTTPETEAVPDDGSLLTADQRRRVEALQVARRTLENKPGVFSGSKLEPTRSVVIDLMTLADWILTGQDDEPLSLQTSRDASNKAYFDSGWNAVRREALAVDEQMGSQPAIDWIRDHPADGRLVDGPEHVATFHPRPVTEGSMPTAAQLIDADDSKSYPEDALPK